MRRPIRWPNMCPQRRSTSTGPTWQRFARQPSGSPSDPCRPSGVVQEVLRALTDRRPKARYFVSFETRLCYTALRIAPFWLRDWLVREGMKLP